MNETLSVLDYIKPELIIVVITLYFIGMMMKSSTVVKDKFIPLFLGIIGIVVSAVFVLASSTIESFQDVLMAIFTAVTQGIVCAGLSNYANQIFKQLKKKE